MKKSADGYKRSTTDKTGIIDPLKLHNTKFQKIYLKDFLLYQTLKTTV